MNLAERINAILKYSNLTPTAFAREIGAKTPQTIYELVKGNTKTLSKSNEIGIVQRFPEINLYWLRTGEGEMLIELPTESDSANSDSVTIVPLLPIAAQAGSLSYFTESVQLKDCEMIISPIKGADYAVRVSGDSMAPEYPNGSQVLIKKIDPTRFIDWGKVYVLDTCNGTVMKQLAPGSQSDRVMCISKNPDPVYAPFEVLFEDIIGMYRVLLCMSVK